MCNFLKYIILNINKIISNLQDVLIIALLFKKYINFKVIFYIA